VSSGRAEARAIPLIVLAVFAWGVGPLFVRGMDVSGTTTAFYRMWLGVPVMYLAARLWGEPLRWSSLRTSLVPGVLFGSSMMLGFEAVRQTSVAAATLIGQLTPAMLLLGLGRFVGERPDPRRLPFAVLAFGGLAVVVLTGADTAGSSLKGDLFALVNVLCFTVYFILLKRRRNAGVDSWTFLSGVFLVGAIVISPWCIATSDDIWAMGTHDYLFVTCMVFGPGVVGHGLITWATRHVPATTTSLLTLMSPVVSVVGAWLIYDQTLGAGTVVGAILVLGGLAGSVWDRRGSTVPEPV